MGLIVQKYGGTSVGSIEKIQHVAQKVIKAKQAGHDVIVVVSAMGGETERLISLAKSAQSVPNEREYSALVSTGEQVTTALLSMALIDKGFKARSFTGKQARILTDDSPKKARIAHIDNEPLQQALSEGFILVVAGFQGYDDAGNITTLGRGGSDTTAVALAASLNADECQIYTDVEGVYTTDPRVVAAAKCLDEITFEEMMELSSLGAKVLQIRAVELVGKYKVPLRVLSTFKEGPGTLVTFEEGALENPVVSGVAFNRNEAKLTIRGVPDEPGIASRILGPISAANIDIDMIIQNAAADETTDFTFTVNRDDYDDALAILNDIAAALGAGEVTGDVKIAKLSIVGVGMRSHSGIAQKMFVILGQENINIQMISTSEIKVSVVVDEKYVELGVRALHTAFGLDVESVEEFDPRSSSEES